MMTWKGSMLALVAIGIVACNGQKQVVSNTDRPNERERALSQQNVDAVIYQHSSAEIYRLYQQCYELASLRLEQNLARPHAKPAAVIVDIDETVLDNSTFQMENIGQGITYRSDPWKRWTDQAVAPALPGAVDFLKGAVSKGCEVFYISNRSSAERDSTMKNLRNAGFPMVNGEHVLCMENGVTDKTDRRKRVSDGHYVALLVGDQLRDFDEAFKERHGVQLKPTVIGGDTVLTGSLCDLENPDQPVNELYGRPTVERMRDTLRQYFIMLPNPMYGTWLDVNSGKADSLKLLRKAHFFPLYMD